MPTQRLVLDAQNTGGMNDRTLTVLAALGLLRELRNIDTSEGSWKRRPGHSRTNTEPMPWTACIGAYAYTDTGSYRHALVVGDDGVVYHSFDCVTWTACTMHVSAIWDATYQATFQAWGNDCFICIGSTDGDGKNLRFRGLTLDIVGVGIDAPATAPAMHDEGVGTMGAGDYIAMVTFVDVSDPDHEFEGAGSAESAVVTLAANRNLHVENIPIYPGTDRTIWRRLYLFATGLDDFFKVIDIEDNTTDEYFIISDDLTSNAVYFEHTPPPVCSQCASLPNGVMLWGNDRTYNLPAAVYFAVNDTNPEAISDTGPVTVGDHSTPLTVLYSVRDGVVAMKRGRGGFFFVTRECEVCERMASGVGSVGWATTQNIGDEVATLTPLGPVITAHDLQTQVQFVGDPRYGFALAGTWRTVVKERLPFATSFHDEERGCVAWAVQVCTESGLHNDTLIVWDYASRSPEYPQGKLHVQDTLIDHGFFWPSVGSDVGKPYGTFPLGFVGQMWHGNHPDHMEAWPGEDGDGFVVSIDGDEVTLDDDGWDFDPTGMVLWVFEGAGADEVFAPCGRSKALILGPPSDKGMYGKGAEEHTYQLAGTLSLDATSKFVLGGFNPILDIDGIDLNDPALVKIMSEVDVGIGAV